MRLINLVVELSQCICLPPEVQLPIDLYWPITTSTGNIISFHLDLSVYLFFSVFPFDFREVLQKLEQSTNGLMRTVDEQGDRIER